MIRIHIATYYEITNYCYGMIHYVVDRYLVSVSFIPKNTVQMKRA